MKTIEQAHKYLDEWFDSGTVGNIIFYHAPGGKFVEILEETVIKAREMDKDTQVAFEHFMLSLGIQRGEVVCGKDGRPDRVKVTRRVDG